MELTQAEWLAVHSLVGATCEATLKNPSNPDFAAGEDRVIAIADAFATRRQARWNENDATILNDFWSWIRLIVVINILNGYLAANAGVANATTIVNRAMDIAETFTAKLQLRHQ